MLTEFSKYVYSIAINVYAWFQPSQNSIDPPPFSFSILNKYNFNGLHRPQYFTHGIDKAIEQKNSLLRKNFFYLNDLSFSVCKFGQLKHDNFLM